MDIVIGVCAPPASSEWPADALPQARSRALSGSFRKIIE